MECVGDCVTGNFDGAKVPCGVISVGRLVVINDGGNVGVGTGVKGATGVGVVRKGVGAFVGVAGGSGNDGAGDPPIIGAGGGEGATVTIYGGANVGDWVTAVGVT